MINVEDLTIGQARQQAALLSSPIGGNSTAIDHGLQIAVLDRGFVYIGRDCERAASRSGGEMNGVTDSYMEWMHADDCPFCGHPTHRVDKSLRCDNCEVTWKTRAEFETDRHGYDMMDDDRDDPGTWWVGSFR